jgi:hypothetical protein
MWDFVVFYQFNLDISFVSFDFFFAGAGLGMFAS